MTNADLDVVAFALWSIRDDLMKFVKIDHESQKDIFANYSYAMKHMISIR